MNLEDLDISHHFGGGVYIKETRIPAGTTLAQHKHKFDHLSYLVEGVATVQVDGDWKSLASPMCLEIKAGKSHSVTAISDCVWLCVWASEALEPAALDRTLVEA